MEWRLKHRLRLGRAGIEVMGGGGGGERERKSGEVGKNQREQGEGVGGGFTISRTAAFQVFVR